MSLQLLTFIILTLICFRTEHINYNLVMIHLFLIIKFIIKLQSIFCLILLYFFTDFIKMTLCLMLYLKNKNARGFSIINVI